MQQMLEDATFFENRAGHRLFGVINVPHVRNDSRTGVVFCHPMSWEKQNSCLAYVHFCRHLARAGYPSIRFDSLGFGDSEGDIFAATIQTQVSDSIDALERLRESSGCSKFVFVGVRSGAAIAALAASQTASVSGLVMVCPVVTGEAYWKDLLRFSRLGKMTLGQQLTSTKDLLAELERTGKIEVDGETLSLTHVNELRGIDLIHQVLHFRGRCLVRELPSGGFGRKALISMIEAFTERGIEVSASFDEPREFWMAKSRYSGYLPTGLFRRTIDWLDGKSA